MKGCDKPGKDELFHISVTITSFVNMHTQAICVRTHHLHSFCSTSVQTCVCVLIFLFLMLGFAGKTEN